MRTRIFSITPGCRPRQTPVYRTCCLVYRSSDDMYYSFAHNSTCQSRHPFNSSRKHDSDSRTGGKGEVTYPQIPIHKLDERNYAASANKPALFTSRESREVKRPTTWSLIFMTLKTTPVHVRR